MQVINAPRSGNLRAGRLIGDIENNPDPQSWLTPIAGLDTYSANDGNSFNGLWNNYPFFKNGAIGVVSIGEGFFMVRDGTRKPVP